MELRRSGDAIAVTAELDAVTRADLQAICRELWGATAPKPVRRSKTLPGPWQWVARGEWVGRYPEGV